IMIITLNKQPANDALSCTRAIRRQPAIASCTRRRTLAQVCWIRSPHQSPTKPLSSLPAAGQLHDLIDFDVDMGHRGSDDLPAEPHAAAATRAPFFECPSDIGTG